MNLNHPNYQRDKFRDARLQNNLLVLKSIGIAGSSQERGMSFRRFPKKLLIFHDTNYKILTASPFHLRISRDIVLVLHKHPNAYAYTNHYAYLPIGNRNLLQSRLQISQYI